MNDKEVTKNFARAMFALVVLVILAITTYFCNAMMIRAGVIDPPSQGGIVIGGGYKLEPAPAHTEAQDTFGKVILIQAEANAHSQAISDEIRLIEVSHENNMETVSQLGWLGWSYGLLGFGFFAVSMVLVYVKIKG